MAALLAGLAASLLLLAYVYGRSRQHLRILRRQQQALNGILWGTSAGSWEWNVKTDELHLNERWADMLGYTLEELAPVTIATWERLCHPEDLERARQALSTHIDGSAESYGVEIRLRHRDGRYLWIYSRGRVLARDPEGAPLLMAGIHIDIDARKEAETQARVIHERLTKLSARLPGTIYQFWRGVDGSMSFPYASEGMKEVYGITPEEANRDVNKVFAIIHRDDLASVSASIEVSTNTLTLWSEIFRVHHPAKGLCWIEGNAVPERLEDGSTMWHGYLRDITESHELQKERDVYRESLEKSNAELEHFAYAASHDLRQPLRMVTSYAGLLKRHLGDQLDADGQTMLHYMSDGAKRMDDMLLSLLEYSRIGRQGESFTEVALRETLDEALHFLAPAVVEASATIRIEGEWPRLRASHDEMTRLFQNLIGNALKYHAGDTSVEVRIDCLRREEGVYITIADNGIGIDPNQIPRLFKVFQRLHGRDEFEGTGVGLALCRKIVERHQGRIWVTSAGKGTGSCFHVVLAEEVAA
ncbi:PAS domain-containing protein [Halomonas sp. PAMB 3264]|uniref:sensor histidine kinase n=1 Tax=unclassified Halomonas TaxID=2609666 RepID=UPI002897266C|nr:MULTISPECIES: PAS domain-containing protein [unclassified Halomonas]WNL39179.1 PAS domain-containing protein [Halomonas sp. PAMB 3232]WNL42522.1 PAS domain-containing protein [Halomonas sp. PAMB 3264]